MHFISIKYGNKKIFMENICLKLPFHNVKNRNLLVFFDFYENIRKKRQEVETFRHLIRILHTYRFRELSEGGMI